MPKTPLRFVFSIVARSLIAGIAAFPIYGTEVAPFMGKQNQLTDSLHDLNQLMNQWIEEAVIQSHLESDCHKDDIRKRILKKSGGQTWTKIEQYISQTNSIEKNITKKQDSLYRDFTFFESPAIHLVSLAPTINLNGFYIGSDKPGHFIQTGYEYFKTSSKNPGNPDKPYKWGMFTERYHLGLLTGGIFSWADLAANHFGFKFWSQLTNKDKGHLSCENGQWKIIRPFDWSEYVNASWDEMINCNDYSTRKMRRKTDQWLLTVGSQCPESREVCTNLVQQFGSDLGKKILHPVCRGK